MTDKTARPDPAADRIGDDPNDTCTARQLPGDDLAAALRAYADSAPQTRAAVELLIDHCHWLHRPDLLDRVEILAHPDGQLLAVIDWEAVAAARPPGSSSAQRILALAGELAGIDSGRPLGELLEGFDETNRRNVLRAVTRATGSGPSPDAQ